MKRPLLLTAAAWLLGELSAENMKSRIASIIIYAILVGITAARRESEKKSGRRKPVGLIWLGGSLLLVVFRKIPDDRGKFPIQRLHGFT